VSVISGEGSRKGGGWMWLGKVLPMSIHLLSPVGGREEANDVAIEAEI